MAWDLGVVLTCPPLDILGSISNWGTFGYGFWVFVPYTWIPGLGSWVV